MNRYAVICFDADENDLGAIGVRAENPEGAKELAMLYSDFVRAAWALSPDELRKMAANLEKCDELLLPSNERELEDVSEFGVPNLLEDC